MIGRLQTLSNLHAVRAAMVDTERSHTRLLSRSLRWGATALGVGGGAYVANRAARATTRAGATYMREEARDYLAGLNAEETARLKARALSLSAEYPSVDAATLHERLRDTAMAMRSVDKAMELADTIARGQTALQSLKGKDQALDEGRRFFKALDTLGKNVDPKEVKDLFHGYIKALGVEGADLNLGDVFIAAKRAKSAGPGMSNRFLMSIAPGLMQDMGADRFGTAMGSTLSQVIGGRGTKPAAPR
jgi:hypothetical protein